MTAPVTPDSFMSDTPPPRIIGSECEYNIQNRGLDGGTLSESAYTSNKALSGVPVKRFGEFFGNGCRLYPYAGHIEYATPECLGPRQAAAADLAGIIVMQRMIEASNLPHRGVYRLSGTYLNNPTGVTSGYHENYLLSRVVSRDKMVDKLVPSHLASRIWAMSGTIRDGNFVFSQKVGGIGGAPIQRSVARRTDHGNKPMVLIPPENADFDTLGSSNLAQQWARLEVRFADPLLSPLARYVGFAATSLVLRMIEHKARLGEKRLGALQLADPVRAAYAFCNDLSMTEKAESVDGKLWGALDIQEALATMAIELSDIVDLPADETIAAHLWLKLCDRLRMSRPDKGQYGNLVGAIEPAARHRYLLDHFDDETIYNETDQVLGMNLAWDRILPEGPGLIWWKHVPSPITQKEIDERITTAPPTRAAIRAHIINTSYPRQIENISWSRINFAHKSALLLSDPYENEL